MNTTKKEHSFQYLYGEFCRIHNCPVLYRINVHVHVGVLDFYGDGINKSDWRPILKALSLDRYLHFVAIRSKAKHRHIIPQNGTRKLSCETNPKSIPRSILTKVAFTLRDYLNVSTKLTGLELDGLHFTMDHLLVLSKYQNLSRFNEKWLQSLRYRTPNTEKMPGLLRVTLSHNKLGDQGVQHIIQVLQDDCWLKAIDLQNCSLTEETGQNILKLFELNDTISIFDVRNNNMISPSTITAIILQLASRQSQFEWSQDGPTCPPRTASQTTVSLTGLRKPSVLRKTTSYVFPSGSKAVKDPRMCSSTPNMNASVACDNSLFQKYLTHRRASSSEAESSSQVETLQKHLEYLRQQLEEEIAKRKEAEATRDKAQSRLESHLQELAETEAAISGRVLVDKNVIQQVNSAFSDVNQLLAMMGGTSVDQSLNLTEYSAYQESLNTKTSFTSETKCYNDEPTSTESSDSKTTDIATDDVRYFSPNAGQGDCLPSDEVDILSDRLKNLGDPEEDSSTLRNSRAEEELKTSNSFSDESDPSWTTMASISSVEVLK